MKQVFKYFFQIRFSHDNIWVHLKRHWCILCMIHKNTRTVSSEYNFLMGPKNVLSQITLNWYRCELKEIKCCIFDHWLIKLRKQFIVVLHKNVCTSFSFCHSLIHYFPPLEEILTASSWSVQYLLNINIQHELQFRCGKNAMTWLSAVLRLKQLQLWTCFTVCQVLFCAISGSCWLQLEK